MSILSGGIVRDAPPKDGLWRGGKWVGEPDVVEDLGWDRDLAEVPACAWESLVGATPEQARTALYVEDGCLMVDTQLAVDAGASELWAGEAVLVNAITRAPGSYYSVQTGRIRKTATTDAYVGFRVTLHDENGDMRNTLLTKTGNMLTGLLRGHSRQNRGFFANGWADGNASGDYSQANLTIAKGPQGTGESWSFHGDDFTLNSSGSISLGVQPSGYQPRMEIPDTWFMKPRIAVYRAAGSSNTQIAMRFYRYQIKGVKA